MKNSIILSIAWLITIAGFCHAGWLPKATTQPATPSATTTAVTPGQVPTAQMWRPWSGQYHQARQSLGKVQPDSPEAATARQKMDEALARGRQLVAGFTGVVGEVEAMMQFVRDWAPADCTKVAIEKLQPHAQGELDAILLEADPFPRYPIRNFLLRWRGIDTSAGRKAQALYDEQAQPAFKEALAQTDDKERAKQLLIFIMQWKPATQLEQAYAQRQKIADDAYSQVIALNDEAARRRGLAVFVKDFPDSRQVNEVRELMSGSRPAIAGVANSGSMRADSVSPRTIIEQLDRQSREAIEHQNPENIERHNREAIDRQSQENINRQNRETVQNQTQENIGDQKREVVQNQASERDSQTDEGGGRRAQNNPAQQARSANQNAAQQARSATNNNSQQARNANTNAAQQARTGQARDGQIR